MEGFTYVDIFATKGIEYLVIIAVLATFVVFWNFLKGPVEAVYQGVANAVSAIGNWFSMPAQGMFFHQGHSWATPEEGNIMKVGMDDFAQKMLGKIDSINLPQVGAEVAQGEKGWSVQVGSKLIDMLSPVDGKIVAVNEALLKSPAGVNSDPYGQSWLIKVQSPRVSSNLKNLLTGDLAIKWMDGVRDSLLARGNYNLGALSQDGGVPVDGIARNMDPENWDKLVKDFFLVS
ncbi:MAG: glycine cleavage system protein H [Syntrophales bacterium]|jgi:glycine cleavage system H lipoate-binding protein|nr:glycine cleavage system protein H [Syntrophales bacterium]